MSNVDYSPIHNTRDTFSFSKTFFWQTWSCPHLLSGEIQNGSHVRSIGLKTFDRVITISILENFDNCCDFWKKTSPHFAKISTMYFCGDEMSKMFGFDIACHVIKIKVCHVVILDCIISIVDSFLTTWGALLSRRKPSLSK